MATIKGEALDIRLGELIALDLKGELQDREELMHCARFWYALWSPILEKDKNGSTHDRGCDAGM